MKSTTWATIIVAALLIPGATVAAQDREREPEIEHLHRILAGLEHGMEALAALERRDALELLGDIADDVRREIEQAAGERPRRRERGNEERRMVEQQTDVLRLAMRALLEGERHDAAHLIEHAIHARELLLEGRNDREAREIRERAPSRGQVLELLALAERLYLEFGLEEKAARIDELCRQLWDERTGRRNEPPAGEAAERERERERRAAEERERREMERADREDRRRLERAERVERDRVRDRERLHQRIERLHHRLEEMHRELEEIRRALEG